MGISASYIDPPRAKRKEFQTYAWLDPMALITVDNAIWRNCELTYKQKNILRMICHRTIGWKKLWDVITMKQFVQGVFQRKEGKLVCVDGGVGFTEAAIQRELKGLLAAGIVRRYLHDPVYNKYAYGIDLTVLMKKSNGIPKRLQARFAEPSNSRDYDQEPGFSGPVGQDEERVASLLRNQRLADAEPEQGFTGEINPKARRETRVKGYPETRVVDTEESWDKCNNTEENNFKDNKTITVCSADAPANSGAGFFQDNENPYLLDPQPEEKVPRANNFYETNIPPPDLSDKTRFRKECVRVWREAHEERFPSVTLLPLTPQNLNCMVSTADGAFRDRKAFLDYLRFCCVEWLTLRKTALAWMTSPQAATFPDIRVILGAKTRRGLVDMFNRRHELDRINALPVEEREAVYVQFATGGSLETAQRYAGMRKSLEREREELKRKREELDARAARQEQEFTVQMRVIAKAKKEAAKASPVFMTPEETAAMLEQCAEIPPWN